MIASGNPADKTGKARLWSADGKLLAEVEVEGASTSATLSPDGRQLLVGLSDGTARLRPVFTDTQTLVDHIKVTTPRCLTQVQRRTLFMPTEVPSWCQSMKK